MKTDWWRICTKYWRRRPDPTMMSWAASILVLGYVIAFATSQVTHTTDSSRQTCTVIVDGIERPLILHTDAFIVRAFIGTLKAELKFVGRLMRAFEKENCNDITTICETAH
jgi:hypothetical protein